MICNCNITHVTSLKEEKSKSYICHISKGGNGNTVHTVKAIDFPVVMYGCENWTIKKAECQRTDSFKLWCLKKTLENPLDSKEIKPVYPKGNQS